MISGEKLTLHQRIRGDIEGRIRSGLLKAGDRIPFETELMQTYGCARMTVNKALTSLAEDGLIERRKRAGSFVRSQRLDVTVLDIPDIEVEVRRRGDDYAFRLLSHDIRKPVGAEELALASGGDLLALQGLHYASGQPLALEERLISLSAVPTAAEVDFAAQSPGHWLLEAVPWTRAEHQIFAEVAGQDLLKRTGWVKGTACLVVVRRTWRGNEPVTRVRQTFDGKAYRLTATLDHV